VGWGEGESEPLNRWGWGGSSERGSIAESDTTKKRVLGKVKWRSGEDAKGEKNINGSEGDEVRYQNRSTSTEKSRQVPATFMKEDLKNKIQGKLCKRRPGAQKKKPQLVFGGKMIVKQDAVKFKNRGSTPIGRIIVNRKGEKRRLIGRHGR